MLRIILYFLWIAALALPASASVRQEYRTGSEWNEYFRTYSRKIIEKIGRSGRDLIGELSLAGLINDVNAVSWSVFPGFLAGSGGKRQTAIYHVESRSVVMSAISWRQMDTEDERETVALHESLGASGYLDENYELTLSLWAISAGKIAPQVPAVGEELFEDRFRGIRKQKTTPTYLASGGGISGVGGGGNDYALTFKKMLVGSGMLWLPVLESGYPGVSRSRLMALVLEASFETSFPPATSQIHCEGNSKSGFTFLIPVVHLLGGPQISAQALWTVIGYMKDHP